MGPTFIGKTREQKDFYFATEPLHVEEVLTRKRNIHGELLVTETKFVPVIGDVHVTMADQEPFWYDTREESQFAGEAFQHASQVRYENLCAML